MIGIVKFEAERKSPGHGAAALRGSAITFAEAEAVVRIDDQTGEITVLKDRYNVLGGLGATTRPDPLVSVIGRAVDTLQALREDLSAIAARVRA